MLCQTAVTGNLAQKFRFIIMSTMCAEIQYNGDIPGHYAPGRTGRGVLP